MLYELKRRNAHRGIAALCLGGGNAVSLAVDLTQKQGAAFTNVLAGIFFLVSVFFVYRSFYGMRIESK